MDNKRIKGRELAERLGVHDSAVSRWRSGRNVPSMDVLTQLAQIFDVDPLRLAVTANLLDGGAVDIKPLPIPRPTVQHENVRRQIESIKGLSLETKNALLEKYEEIVTHHPPQNRSASQENGV